MNEQQIEKKKATINRRILKLILNFWTIVTIGLLVLDFFSGNKYNSSVSAIGAIYLAMLGIYVSEKEFIRWKTKFSSKFIGESFVGVWTAIMAMFVIAAPLSNGAFSVPTEFPVIYTSVIGVFAITQHSKSLKRQERLEDLPKNE